jgi:hypothetical protein
MGIGKISSGPFFLTLPTLLSTGQILIASSGLGYQAQSSAPGASRSNFKRILISE